MNVQITIALMTGVVTATGWFVSSLLLRRADELKRRRESRLKYIERQIEELYGPLFNTVMQIVVVNHVRDSLTGNLNSHSDNAMKDQIDELFYVDYFRPLHDEVRQLLKSRLHLVEGSQLPESFYEYLRHSMQERVQYDLWRNHRLDTISIPGVEYPDQFTLDVQGALQSLLAEYDSLLGKLHEDKASMVDRASG